MNGKEEKRKISILLHSMKFGDQDAVDTWVISRKDLSEYRKELAGSSLNWQLMMSQYQGRKGKKILFGDEEDEKEYHPVKIIDHTDLPEEVSFEDIINTPNLIDAEVDNFRLNIRKLRGAFIDYIERRLIAGAYNRAPLKDIAYTLKVLHDITLEVDDNNDPDIFLGEKRQYPKVVQQFIQNQNIHNNEKTD